MNEPIVPTAGRSLLAGLAVVVLAQFWLLAPAPLTGDGLAWTIALALYAVIAASVRRGLAGHHPHRQFGTANQVTLVRAAVVCALAGALVGTAEPGWILWLLAGLAALLDGVDGWLARRAQLASRFGARFDMEIDALLILVLALLAWRSGRAGPWILAAGAMRYAFVAAASVWPWLAAPLPASTRRKAVCAIQVVSLLLCLLPIMPVRLATGSAALGLLALSASFARDIGWLWRQRP